MWQEFEKLVRPKGVDDLLDRSAKAVSSFIKYGTWISIAIYLREKVFHRWPF